MPPVVHERVSSFLLVLTMMMLSAKDLRTPLKIFLYPFYLIGIDEFQDPAVVNIVLHLSNIT